MRSRVSIFCKAAYAEKNLTSVILLYFCTNNKRNTPPTFFASPLQGQLEINFVRGEEILTTVRKGIGSDFVSDSMRVTDK